KKYHFSAISAPPKLAAEADKPPNAAPTGRAGSISSRRTASRRLQTLNGNTLCSAASGVPLVRSRASAACSLTSDPLAGPPYFAAAPFPHPAAAMLKQFARARGEASLSLQKS